LVVAAPVGLQFAVLNGGVSLPRIPVVEARPIATTPLVTAPLVVPAPTPTPTPNVAPVYAPRRARN